MFIKIWGNNPELEEHLEKILDPNVDPSTLSTKKDWVHPELKDFVDGTKPMSELVDYDLKDNEPIPLEFLEIIRRTIQALHTEMGEISPGDREKILEILKRDGLEIEPRFYS